MLEQTPMTDKYRGWIEAVSAQFGGLDLCALEVLVARDGREIIMELNDCALPLLGDSQEEDRRLISELVLHRMNVSHSLSTLLCCCRCSCGGAGQISIQQKGYCCPFLQLMPRTPFFDLFHRFILINLGLLNFRGKIIESAAGNATFFYNPTTLVFPTVVIGKENKYEKHEKTLKWTLYHLGKLEIILC